MGFSETSGFDGSKPPQGSFDCMDRLLVDRCVELILRAAKTRIGALEIGCGDGYSTEQLAKHFDDLEALDSSADNLSLAKSRVGRNLVVHNMRIEEFRPGRKYQNVIFTHVLEHVDDPLSCLRHLESVLCDEGQIYIAVPNCMALNRRAGLAMGLLDSYDTMAPKDLLVGHRRLYTVEMLRDQCEGAGLRVVSMQGIYLKPLSESQMYSLGDSAVRAFYRLGEDVPQYCADLFAVATKRFY